MTVRYFSFAVLFFLPSLCFLQNYELDCKAMMARGDALYRETDPNLDKVLTAYLNALNCDSKLALQLGPKIQQVFRKIEQQKKDEAAARERAETERKRAERERDRADREALESKAIALAAQAREIAPRDPTAALNLALAGYKTFPTLDGAAALHDMGNIPLQELYSRVFKIPENGKNTPFNFVSLSPNGRFLLCNFFETAAKYDPLSTASPSPFYIWDIWNNQFLWKLPENEGKWPDAFPRFSKDGVHLISIRDSTTIVIRKLTTGKALYEFEFYRDKKWQWHFGPATESMYYIKDQRLVQLDLFRNKIISHFPVSGAVSSFSISPSGEFAAIIDTSMNIGIWGLKSGKLEHQFEGNKDALKSPDSQDTYLFPFTGFEEEARPDYVAPPRFSPDEKYLAIKGKHAIRIADGKPISTENSFGTAYKIEFSQDGRYFIEYRVADLGRDQKGYQAFLKEAQNGKDLKAFGTQYEHFFLSNGSQLLLQGNEGKPELFSLDSLKTLRLFEGLDSEIEGLRLSEDEKYLLGFTKDTIGIWEVRSGRLVRTMMKKVNSPLEYFEAAFLPVNFFGQAETAVLMAEGPVAKVWILDRNPEISISPGPAESAISSVISQMGPSGECGGCFTFFSKDARKMIYTLGTDSWIGHRDKGETSFGGFHELQKTRIPFYPEFFSKNQHYVLGKGPSGRGILWEAETGKEVFNFQIDVKNRDGGLLQMGLSADEKYLVTAGTGRKRIQLLRVQNNAAEVFKTIELGNQVNSIDFSRDSRFLLTGSSSLSAEKGNLILWELSSGALIRRFEGHSGGTNGALFLPNGNIISGGWDDTIRIWNSKTGRQLQKIDGYQGVALGVGLAISPDGKYILGSGADNAAHIWDATTGFKLRTIQMDKGHLSSVAFSEDGGRLFISWGIYSTTWWNYLRAWDPTIYKFSADEREKYRIDIAY